jgi:hypothetical protein
VIHEKPNGPYAAQIRQYKQSKYRFHIFVSDPQRFCVTRDGRLVENWQELQSKARESVEPLVRARWAHHWSEVALMAQDALSPDASLEALMPCSCIIAPSTVYPCPPWLAEMVDETM